MPLSTRLTLGAIWVMVTLALGCLVTYFGAELAQEPSTSAPSGACHADLVPASNAPAKPPDDRLTGEP